ncbi:hypothetical protein PHYBLDRAFT_179417 [Phycomyces blakesleeanus NRRL 1555(-)]|uniref:E3 UFM1-protein ligase 1-like N-terminal domain-containing protein n=1 Tax=Phycomyces blakesleeanus (strain ATCC 8743b / DSM 1359 / FGSC 10004 / NBRC 33097 / NRRL 1555) TaxID=763407 RepID=A0A162YDY9_PHYB8|nr:hypothetical protein PHYBLDRAFT_179417 [Phycomyces blakesleeanus NRRL 1555(-)]OAD80145.1 hypothetical protein PHYBLDRAFT_179417 [Phycomyces blakesleeanus NRRL 1555(-)]|eukprot:XP_018298185.1 hypothetical protein PHYBLDRAFT_179417 [Phycomyces blakesleeanus NRRL 1555(-)]
MVNSVLLTSTLFKKLIDQGIQRGYLNDFLPTLDGESYLTKQHIQLSIQNHVMKHGRASIAELADLLNLEQSCIIQALNDINEFIKVDDLVFTSKYIDGFINQIKDRVDQTGWVSVLAQAQSISLPYAFLQTILDEKLLCNEDYIKYSTLPDLILSEEYYNKSIETIKGALEEASDKPIHIVMVDGLAKENVLKGHFRGRRERAVFEPTVYRDRQVELIFSLLEAAGYIEYETVVRHYPYMNPTDLLKKNYPNILLLDGCAATEDLVKKLEAKIQETYDTSTWLDASAWAPFVFTPADATGLLEHTMTRLTHLTSPTTSRRSLGSLADPENRLIVLESRFVTSTRYLEELIKSSTDFLNKRALSEIQQQKKTHSSKGKKHRADDKGLVLTEQEICKYLIEECGLEKSFARSVSTTLRRPMTDAFQRAIQTVYLPSSNNGSGTLLSPESQWIEALKKRQQTLLSTLHQTIVYTTQAIQIFKDESGNKSLEKYVVRVLCLEWLYNFLVLQTLSEAYDIAGVEDAVGVSEKDLENQKKISEDHQKMAIQRMLEVHSSDVQLKDLHQAALAGKKPDLFLSYFESSPPNFFKPLTENVKKQAWKDMVNSLGRLLNTCSLSESTGPSILHITSLICFEYIYHNTPFSVSGKYVPLIIRHCTPQLEAKDQSKEAKLLNDAHAMIMAHVKSKQPVDLDLLAKVKKQGQQWVSKLQDI